jgi:serine/threonine-protein kinase
MQAGFVIRDYMLEEKIGEGGMGEVWRSRHRMLDKPVAIKVMAEQLLTDPQFEARFIQEAQAQARLQHPHIIGATDFFREQGRYYLVMPMIEGISLEERLTRGPLPVEEALRISADVLAALDYAHQRAVIHRDVKPSNILIDREGRAFLTDFGIALMLGQERKTRTGVSIGTPHYMSPEQIRRPRSVDHRTDVYSFGCVLYEMLAGRPPFEADASEEETDYVIKEAHVHRTPEPVRRWNPSVPEAVDSIVMRSLAKNPDERFVSCGELAREFLSVMQFKPPQIIPSHYTLPEPEVRGIQKPPYKPQAPQQRVAEPLARPVNLIAWWLLGLSALFVPIWGIGIIGIVGAIGMLRGRDWGRRAGLVFSLLLEVAGLAVAFGIVINMGTETISSSNVATMAVTSILAMASASIGTILAFRLGHESVMIGLKNDSKRPAGILPIAIPMLLTGFGTLPALGLLGRRNWGRVAMMIFLWLFALVSFIGAIVLGGQMRIVTYNYYADSYWDRYRYSPNEIGFAIAVNEAMVVLIMCVMAFFYLKSSRVKTWFK